MYNYFIPEKNEIKGKINLVLYFTILGYIISLFIKDAPVITNILMVSILLLALFSVSPSDYFKRLLQNKVNCGFIIFYLYQIVSVLFSSDTESGFAILILRLPMLILPFAFCFIDFKKNIWDKTVIFYALITTFASIIGFSFGVYKSISEKDSGFLYNDNISAFLSKQAVYFAFYISIAIMAFVIQLQHNSFIQKYRLLIYTCIIWLLFILFMLASRTAMFGLLLTLVIYVIKITIQKRKFFEGILILFTIIIGSVLVSKSFPKTLNRFIGTTETGFQFNNKNIENHFNAEYDESKWNSTNTRAAIWKCAYEIWETHPFMGTGLGDRNNSLMKKYEEHQFWYGLNTHKNTHNQYLDILISLGVVGLMLFLTAFFLYPTIVFFKKKQIFAFVVFALLAICFITENMLDRYQGLILISFILPLSVKVNQ